MTTPETSTAQPSSDNVARALAAPPPRRSSYTARQKLIRLLWGTVGRALWVIGIRAPVLRLFGGRIGKGCRLARSARITIPSTVTIGDGVVLGERSIVYSLGEITIGDRVVLDFRAHLCAGTHDMSDPRFPLVKPPIEIGAASFIGMDAYVGPGVVLGARCVVGARASVFKSFPDDTALSGNPARPVRDER